jgi:hypothetical protein
MNRPFLLAGAATLAIGVGPASAAIVSLQFDGIAPYPHLSSTIFVQEYYNGGTSSIGTSGPNVGVSFGANALIICLNKPVSPSCSDSNTSRGPGHAGTDESALFFLSGSETFMNVPGGFDTGFSFNYVSVSFAGSVGVYDGLNGTGTLLATLNLVPNANAGAACAPFGYVGGFCPFGPVGVLFSGTARSVSFGGVANQIVFDDITFGTDVPGPGPVPAPAAVLLFGLGALALGAARRR